MDTDFYSSPSHLRFGDRSRLNIDAKLDGGDFFLAVIVSMPTKKFQQPQCETTQPGCRTSAGGRPVAS